MGAAFQTMVFMFLLHRRVPSVEVRTILYGLGWSYGSRYMRASFRAPSVVAQKQQQAVGVTRFCEVNGISDFRFDYICEYLAWGATSIMRERPLDMRLPSMMS